LQIQQIQMNGCPKELMGDESAAAAAAATERQ
jgi:hypothetical protein